MSKSKATVLIYKALTKAVEEDKLRIYLDYAKINKTTCPVYNPWESLLPILIPIVIGLLMIIFVGVFWGLTFIILMILAYSAHFKKIAHKKLIARTKSYIIESLDKCEELWNFGGIIFVNKDNKKIGCVSPEGDWKEFVVINFSQYMTDGDKPKEVEEIKDEKEKPVRRRRGIQA